MGTPEFAVGSLKKLIEEKYNIVGIVTTADKPSGRGQKLSISPIKEFALGYDIPILQPISLKDPEFLSQLRNLEADLFIVVAFRKLPKEVWNMPKMGSFNLHASLLPKFRGAAPINHAIIQGEKETGVTTFFLDDKIDTGNILFREKCDIYEDEDLGSLYERLMSLGSDLVLKTVDAIANGSINPTPQSEIVETNLALAPKLNRENRLINWHKDIEAVHNHIRGLSPYPCAYSIIKVGDKQSEVKIFKSRINISASKMGEVKTDGKTYLTMGCKGGSLEILELQLAGKKRMNIKEFLAGIRNPDEISFIFVN